MVSFRVRFMTTQQHIFHVRLSQPQRDFLERLARQNDRSRAAQIRQLIERERMQTDGQPASQLSPFAREGA
jgi:hypothetical protein